MKQSTGEFGKWVASLAIFFGATLLLAVSAAGQQCEGPTARTDRFSLPAGEEATYSVLVPDPLLNDSNSSGRPLTFAMDFTQGNATNGQFAAGPEGQLLFTGSRNSVGIRYFSYTAQQAGGGGSDVGSIRVSEGFEFEALPSTAPDYYTFQGCGTYTLDVLSNDTIPGGAQFGKIAEIRYGPLSHGTVTIEDRTPPLADQLRYQPQPCTTFVGADEFEYVVRVNGEEYSGLVHVDVTAAPPSTSARPCFNLLNPNQAASATEPPETQLDGVFDRGCSSDGTPGGGPPFGYCWDWGDGTPLELPDGCAGPASYHVGAVCEGTQCYPGRRYVHRYQQLGTYVVRLRVKNASGDWSDWSGRPVTISNRPPTAVLAPILCYALDCSVDASGSSDDDGAPGSLTFTWDFGDDSPLGSGAQSTHRYPDLGSYPLTLVVTDSQNAVDVQTRTVEVIDRPPHAKYTLASCGDRCLGFLATSTDDFGLAGHEWRWQRLADGASGLLGVGTSAQLQSSLLGLYAVTLTSTDGAGQSDSVTKRVLLDGALQAATDWWILPPGATEVAFDPRANDGPGTGLTITHFGSGQYGTVTAGPNGTLRYQLSGPRPAGTDHFAYTVTDAAGNSAQGSVRIVTLPIGEVGRAESVTHLPQDVTLRRDDGTTPLVFALPASANDPEPAAARVTGVKPGSFSVHAQEPGNGTHGPETVDYLVIAPLWQGVEGSGLGTLEDGRRFAAGRLTVGQSLGLGPGNSIERWVSVSLPWEIGATAPPIVLAQTQTDNDPTWVSVRVDQVDATHFRLALEVPEAAVGHGAETVAWVAFPAGTSDAQAPLLFEATETGDKFTGTFLRFGLKHHYPLPPLVLATLRGRNDTDPAVLRRRFIDVEGVELAVQEDTTRDAETTHGLEAASVLAFAEPALLAGTTLPFNAADGGGLVAVDDRFRVWASKQTILPVLFNDQPGSGALEILGFTQPVHGRVTRLKDGESSGIGTLPIDSGTEGEPPTDGEFLYQTPAPEFRGWDAFEYTVRDDAGNRATLTVWIEVVGENEP